MEDISRPARPPVDLYITNELARRTPQVRDYLQEKEALQELAGRMVDRPEEVLPKFVDLAMAMTGGTSAGLSLYEEGTAPGVFRWRYLRGALAPFEGATTPRDYSPCGVTLDENRPVLSRHPERYYDWISGAHIVVPEVLLVPLFLGGEEPLGTLWVVAEREGHFDSGHARAATELASFVGIALRMLKSENQLQSALEEQKTLAREMNHRVKNLFSVAQGLVRISEKGSESVPDMAQQLIGRFHALASAHALVRRDFAGANEPVVSDLGQLLVTILRPYEQASDRVSSRFLIAGPAIPCGQHALNGIALVFHELALNAAKYGALVNIDGQIDVRWEETGDNLVFQWVECGGPPLAGAPTASGFGSKLLADTVRRQFGGHLNHKWNPEGLTINIDLPLARLST